MGSVNRVSEVDYLEAQLLTDPGASSEYEESIGAGKVLHRATFDRFEREFLQYETLQWILISLLLILAWGIGVLLLVYTPIRRYVMRQDFRSRELYVTSDAVVYKVTRPVFLPWLGVSKMEKCILLPLITDIVVEQGCLQSIFGLHSIRIETLGQGSPLAAYNVHICGMTHPKQLRKVILAAATMSKKDGNFPLNSFRHEGKVILGLPGHSSESGNLSPSLALSRSMSRQMSSPRAGGGADPSFFGERLLRKLEELGNALKKIEKLMESRGESYDAKILPPPTTQDEV